MISFKSALVSGATGFIGSNLVKKLSKKGVETYCLVRTDLPNPHPIKALPAVHMIEISDSRSGTLKDALKDIHADVVFNMAAYGVSQSHRDPELMLEGNLRFLSNLLISVSDWSLKQFIHTGSCSEYAAIANQELITEKFPIEPDSFYGAAKAASVIYGRALAHQLEVPFTTLRLFGVYGVGEASQRLIPYLIQNLANDEKVDLTPGEQVRDFLYVEDVVDAFITAASVGRKTDDSVLNICSGKPLRIKDIGMAVAKAMNKPETLLQWGARRYRGDEAMWIVGDNTRITSQLDWKPRISLSEGIGMMIKYFREKGFE